MYGRNYEQISIRTRCTQAFNFNDWDNNTFFHTFLWKPYKIKSFETETDRYYKFTINDWQVHDSQMTYTDYNVCFKRCRVFMWNDAELSYAHTRRNQKQSFEQSNRMLSLEHSNVANESIKQREIHIYYILPYLPECLTKSNHLSWKRKRKFAQIEDMLMNQACCSIYKCTINDW